MSTNELNKQRCFETEKKVNVSPIANLKVGEYVLIHADLALQKIDKQEADELKELLNGQKK